MIAHFLLGFDPMQWESWLIPLIGLGFAGLSLYVGSIWFRPRGKRVPYAKPCKALEDPFVKPSARDRRQAFRRGSKLVKVLVSDIVAKAPPETGWVLDRSVGGLCLILEKSLSENTILSVRTVDAPKSTPWVQVQVRRCQAFEEQWEVGCAFVRTPPWGVLLLFG